MGEADYRRAHRLVLRHSTTQRKVMSAIMKKTWIVTPLLLLALAGGSYGLYRYMQPEPLPERILYGNGHIEGTEIIAAVLIIAVLALKTL